MNGARALTYSLRASRGVGGRVTLAAFFARFRPSPMGHQTFRNERRCDPGVAFADRARELVGVTVSGVGHEREVVRHDFQLGVAAHAHGLATPRLVASVEE